ncbi:MAG TPA: DNA-3-methyladenine glycosylase I [Nitriliruptorales bacterium]|nr:DNA-3-methyladenine glycosylase I [Nitriliruptorales bacterium]
MRCWWCGDDALYVAYHDHEWGRPVHDDRRLFEKLCLEGFQAGLSWLTILRKRPAFRAAFEDFDIEAVAGFDDTRVERLVADPTIVRHRGKISSAINNARRSLEVIDEFGTLDAFVWRSQPPGEERPDTIRRATLERLGAPPAAHRLARELRRRGFTFVGAITVYAFMEAMGLVNDHLEGCAVRAQITG